MEDLKISVVMPSYNQAVFIEEAIESVLNQSYANVELVIVDGLSTDGTVEKLEKYRHSDRVRKIIIEKDKGQADALRKGFQYCTGDIYAWLNSDDVYVPGALELVAKTYRDNPGIDVLNGSLNVIDEHSKWVATWPQRRITNRQWLHYPQTIGQPSTFFSAGIFRKVGGLNPDLSFAMDYDLFFRFALANARFHFMDEYLANFRVHGQSKTMSLPYKFWKEEIKVFHSLSGGKILSGFYYWKFRGILSLIIKQHILKTRKF